MSNSLFMTFFPSFLELMLPPYADVGHRGVLGVGRVHPRCFCFQGESERQGCVEACRPFVAEDVADVEIAVVACKGDD